MMAGMQPAAEGTRGYGPGRLFCVTAFLWGGDEGKSRLGSLVSPGVFLGQRNDSLSTCKREGPSKPV